MEALDKVRGKSARAHALKDARTLFMASLKTSGLKWRE
jgi:hypothetical protein